MDLMYTDIAPSAKIAIKVSGGGSGRREEKPNCAAIVGAPDSRSSLQTRCDIQDTHKPPQSRSKWCVQWFTVHTPAVGTWWGKIGVAAFAVHQYDTHFRYARFNRNVRSVGAAVATLVDYKIVLARKPESLEDLHERVAKRWYDVCCTNAGLYIKLGQQIATMNFVLPPAYQ
eukprot:1956407-Rhodomonas_salina.1